MSKDESKHRRWPARGQRPSVDGLENYSDGGGLESWLGPSLRRPIRRYLSEEESSNPIR